MSSLIIFSAEDKETIVARYLAGESAAALSRDFDVSCDTIFRSLRRWGIQKRPMKVIRRGEFTEMVRRYRSGESIESIAACFGIQKESTWNLFYKNGVRLGEIRTRRVGDSCLNEDAFKEITEESAYWAGFLMADGCVVIRPNSKHLTLQLAVKDKPHVEKFRAFLGSGHKLSEAVSQSPRSERICRFARISISSARLCDDLIKFGVTPRKSLSAQVVGLENDRNFWRGVVDGDGSIAVHKQGHPHLYLVGCKPLMGQFADFVRTVSPRCKAIVKPRRTIYVFQTGGSTARDVVEAIYGNCAVALDRKLVIARRIMGILYRNHGKIRRRVAA